MGVNPSISLRRRLHFDIMNMAFGNNTRSESKNCNSLRNCTWTIIGRGHVSQSLVRRLVGLGLHRIIVWNHRITLDIFQEVFSNVGVVSWVSRSNRKPCAVVGASAFLSLVPETWGCCHQKKQGLLMNLIIKAGGY